MFGDELGADLMRDFWSLRNVQQPLADILNDPQRLGAWCADARTADGVAKMPDAANAANAANGVDGPARCARLQAASLDAALADLRQRYGDPAQWRWGLAHPALSEHRPFGKVPLLARFFNVRVASPGDAYTVNVGRFNLADEQQPFANRHAASLRALYDLSDLEQSRFMHSSGQSGNPLLPGYRNFARRWVAVDYIPMQMRRALVEQQQLGTLRLLPR
jgi:penicillin amidase